MEELLGNIYCWFESLFGQNLAEYLWGYNCETQGYSNVNLFNSIGLLTIVVVLIFVLAYYYLPLYLFNHPRSNRWWNWLIILGLAGFVNFLIASIWTVNDFLNGNIGDCLIYTRDEGGNIVVQHIYETNCFLFGLSNIFISTLFFILFSILFERWSRNCKYSPF